MLQFQLRLIFLFPAIKTILITLKAQQKPYFLSETQAQWTVRSLQSMALEPASRRE
jgi:hypothetical protein